MMYATVGESASQIRGIVEGPMQKVMVNLNQVECWIVLDIGPV